MARTTEAVIVPPREGAAGSAHLLRVDVARIRPYARNPRQQPNPEYSRLKASISAQGLDQPLVIAQVPGDEDFVLLAGGNTRLQILKELYQETGDERFLQVDCLCKPWVQDSHQLLAHLRENELRGELCFIDKARAVFEAKQLLEAELDVAELSQRQLEALLRECGLSLGHSMISKMGYAVHTLWPLIPQALTAGLGRPQVERIRAIERAARRVWQRLQLGEDSVFDMVFAELCRRYDAPEWDSLSLKVALENELAEEADVDLQRVRLEMDAYLSGNDFPVFGVEEGDRRAIPSESATDNSVDHRQSSQISGLPDSHGEEGLKNPKTQAAKLRKDHATGALVSLRQRACVLAEALAHRNGLAGLVKPLDAEGLGYVLTGLPAPELTESLDEALLGQVSTLWWQLAACAEMTVAPVDHLLPHLCPDSILYRALASQDAALLFGSVWTLDPGHVGHQLWWQLDDQDWQDLLSLMETYRQLKRGAQATGAVLWHGE